MSSTRFAFRVPHRGAAEHLLVQRRPRSYPVPTLPAFAAVEISRGNAMNVNFKVLLGAGLLAIAPASFAQNYSMDLTSVGNGTVADGVYVSPYVGTISGPGMSYSGFVICDDFNSEAVSEHALDRDHVERGRPQWNSKVRRAPAHDIVRRLELHDRSRPTTPPAGSRTACSRTSATPTSQTELRVCNLGHLRRSVDRSRTAARWRSRQAAFAAASGTNAYVAEQRQRVHARARKRIASPGIPGRARRPLRSIRPWRRAASACCWAASWCCAADASSAPESRRARAPGTPSRARAFRAAADGRAGQTGSRTVTRQPSPSTVSMSSVPPAVRTRSRSCARPKRRPEVGPLGSARRIPTPSSMHPDYPPSSA